MARIFVVTAGLLATFAGVAAAHKITSNDRNDQRAGFDMKSVVTTHSKSAFTFKFTLYDDVVDSDFTEKDATEPEEDRSPPPLASVGGNRLCALMERRVSSNTLPKTMMACTGKVSGGKLTARLWRVSGGEAQGGSRPITASRRGRTVTLVVPTSKLPRAKNTYVSLMTRYSGPPCASPCYDQVKEYLPGHNG